MNIAETLKKNNQTHILDALNKLSGAEHDKLQKQIEAIDWDHLSAKYWKRVLWSTGVIG